MESIITDDMIDEWARENLESAQNPEWEDWEGYEEWSSTVEKQNWFEERLIRMNEVAMVQEIVRQTGMTDDVDYERYLNDPNYELRCEHGKL